MLEFRAGDLLLAGEEYIAQGVAEGNQEGLGGCCTHTFNGVRFTQKW